MRQNRQGWKTIQLFVGFIFLSGVLCRPAHAYLDPGSGSYFFQILIASLIGGLYAVKLYWRRIILFFKERVPKNKSADDS